MILRARQDRFPSVPSLKFLENVDGCDYKFQWSDPNSAYLRQLREQINADSIIKNTKDDINKVQKLSEWVHNCWPHSGDNSIQALDPISILEHAKHGKRFSCVEYSIVLRAVLIANHIPARVVNLKMKGVETIKSGAGHVVTEAFLKDFKKWIMIDCQWNAIYGLNNLPLNSVELQNSIAQKNSCLKLNKTTAVGAKQHLKWIAPYLFYFDVKLDQRVDKNTRCPQLMLVPIGAKKPKVFQRVHPMHDIHYTHSLATFYMSPHTD